jgi:uncharacterized protein (TIGR02646 family)
MIHIDRSKIQPPDEWKRKAALETERVKEFFSPDELSQIRWEFKEYLWAEIKSLLLDLFHNKCAYCETPIVRSGHVDHFRPKVEALEIVDKKIKSRAKGYYWLAYEWENLYPVCDWCSSIRGKRNYFPVVGARAQPFATGEELRKEKAVFLDPCHDRPELYLAYQMDGTVRSVLHPDPAERERYEGIDRAAVTIQHLGLNRDQLVHQRRQEAEYFRREVLILVAQLRETKKLDVELAQLTQATQPYAGMRRQILAQLGDELKGMLGGSLAEIEQKLPETVQPELDALKRRSDPATQTIITPQVVPSSRTGYIKSIEINNFKAIKNLKLNFREPQTGASWKMLLGENASGKSTALKAVALALMGEEYVKAHGGANNLLRRNAKSGFVRVLLSSDSEPIEFRFTKRKITFLTGAEGANLFLRAYGATRLLPREISPDAPSGHAKTTETTDEESKEVDNLFDPFVTLCDPESWLSNLDENGFNSAGLTLRDLVHLQVETPLTRNGKEVMLDIGDGPLSFEEQSAGYQAVLGLATDIMGGIPGSIHDKQQASGIVLLDEIDAHLHPRWKMEIVKSLRAAFTNIQFLVTTHEPLCLRGLQENEIALMTRESGQISVKDNLPSPAGLRVDQLLTSELFGLNSTIDPDVEAKFNEYYRLLAKRTLTPEEQIHRNKLKVELEPYGVLGYTRRDQLIYKVIDEYLAQDLITSSQQRRARLRKETKEKVANIWRRVNARGGVR